MNGADVNARDNDWWTPLHAAAACGHWRIANFLLSNGADVTAVNADGDLAIDIVEGEKTGEVIEAEMTRLGYTEDKFEELRDGPRKHLAEMVDKMLKDKADLNAKDANGATPVRWRIEPMVLRLLH
jgi:protein phosphatase 1 regulatory subunit 16A